MGGCDFMFSRKGTNAEKLFREARQEALYEHGHGGYSGTIAEKSDFVIRRGNQPVLPLKDARVMAEADIEENDKWGPAFAMPFGDGGKIEGYIFYGIASE